MINIDSTLNYCIPTIDSKSFCLHIELFGVIEGYFHFSLHFHCRLGHKVILYFMSAKRNIACALILNNYPVGVLVIKALVPFKKKTIPIISLIVNV